MAKHRRPTRSTTSAARAGVSVAAVGLGALQLGALGGTALAQPATPAEPAPDAEAPTAPAAKPAPDAPAGAAADVPCAAKYAACVRLSTNEAWLTDGQGRTITGPVRMNSGSAEDPTPTGVFTVNRKDRYHVSKEANDASMPYSVFFDDEGRAFHAGDPARQSAGCIRLPVEAAKQFFAGLEPGDQVRILP